MHKRSEKLLRSLKSKYFKLVIAELIKHKTILLLLTSVLVFQAMVPVMQVNVLQRLTNNLQKGNLEFHLLIAYLSLCLMIPEFISIICSILNKKVNYIVDVAISKKVYDKIQCLPIHMLENGAYVNLISRVFSIRSTEGTNIISFFITLIVQIISIILLIINLGVFSIAFLAISVIASTVMFILNDKINALNYTFDKEHESHKRHINIISSLLSDKNNALELYAYDTRRKYSRKKKALSEALFREEIKEKCKREPVIILSYFVYVMTMALFYIYTIVLLSNNLISVSIAVSAIVSGATQIFKSVDQCVFFLTSLKSQRHRIAEFEDFFSLKEYQYLNESQKSVNEDINGFTSILLENVKYRYNNSDNSAINGINLRIGKNEKIAIVGLNGAGKSTLIRLLLGIDRPTEGFLEFEDKRKDYCNSIWKLSSVMLQNFYHYPYSIRENIVLNDWYLNRNNCEFESITSWTQIDRFVSNLPEGYDTVMTDEGFLSGGEWQKIALARAKYKSAKIYVLDEPNAAVDAKYEIEMLNKLVELTQDGAAIVVSHRLPICQICDKVVVMQDGVIIEEGSHEELLQKEGVYQKMYLKQASLYT